MTFAQELSPYSLKLSKTDLLLPAPFNAFRDIGPSFWWTRRLVDQPVGEETSRHRLYLSNPDAYHDALALQSLVDSSNIPALCAEGDVVKAATGTDELVYGLVLWARSWSPKNSDETLKRELVTARSMLLQATRDLGPDRKQDLLKSWADLALVETFITEPSEYKRALAQYEVKYSKLLPARAMLALYLLATYERDWNEKAAVAHFRELRTKYKNLRSWGCYKYSPGD